MLRQSPVTTHASSNAKARSQYAALCYRLGKKGKVKILLVTSRGTGRWVMPKGWPIEGFAPADSAAQEAWEEAGVLGRAGDQCLGLYSYQKWRDRPVPLAILVMVYPLAVREMVDQFPEQGQRQRRWFSPTAAASCVDEPELARLLQGFDPDVLQGTTHST